MESKKQNSYTAANNMPFKLLKNKPFLENIIDKEKIIPVHIQVSPTNLCNLNCPFCSCSDVEKGQELSIKQLKEIVDISKSLNTKAYTITGGGEPTLHPHINEFLEYAHGNGISLGLVSNGLKLNKISPANLKKLTWARISFGDFREFSDKFKEQMDLATDAAKDVDWAFSYVVGREANLLKIARIINYANNKDFTHVRLVPDLFEVGNINMGYVKNNLTSMLDCSKVIFQNRSEYTKGDKDCLISLLKPMIAADGNVYPCCGVQYALPDKKDQKCFPKSMSMGHYKDLPKIIEKQKQFDGSVCVKCYYGNYNSTLKDMKIDYDHKDFV